DNQVAGVIYATGGLITALGFNLLWRYASHKCRLISKTASEADIQKITRNYNIGFALYFAAFVVSFLSAPLTLLINFFLALFFAIPSRENSIARIETS
ncbi:MAG: hypothetical protein SFZ02_15315, partial [bacterium]|nr:hypothetical protein [bacterium]